MKTFPDRPFHTGSPGLAIGREISRCGTASDKRKTFGRVRIDYVRKISRYRSVNSRRIKGSNNLFGMRSEGINSQWHPIVEHAVTGPHDHRVARKRRPRGRDSRPKTHRRSSRLV